MKSRTRIGLVVFITLAWLALVCVALEAYETMRLYRAAHASQNYFEENVGAIPGMIQVGARGSSGKSVGDDQRQDTDVGEPAFDAGSLVSIPEAGPCNVSGPVPQTPEEVGRARRAYAEIGEENRNVIATLEGEFGMTLDGTGRCLSSYGDPLLEQGVHAYLTNGFPLDVPHELVDAIRRAQSITEPSVCETDFQWNHYEIDITPQRNADNQVERIAITARERGDSRRFGVGTEYLQAPADSEWEVPMYRLKKNFQSGVVRNNNFGFKDHDVVVPKPAGVFRIACVGGSATQEGDVTAVRYSNLMQEILQAKFGPEAVEVINCGICGIDSYGERRRMQDFLAIQPDLIVYYNAVNDVGVRHMAIWNEHVAPWQKSLRRSRFLNRWFNHAFLPSDAYIAEFMKATTMRNLRAMCYAARERGVAMALCSFACPDLAHLDSAARDYLDVTFRNSWQGKSGQHPDYTAYTRFLAIHNRLLKDLCEHEGVLYVPVAENFHHGMDYFKDVCHMKTRGMRLKAEIIAAHITPCIEYALSQWKNAAQPPTEPRDVEKGAP